MNVGFIGAGKVSKAMGIYFKERGIGIAGYYSRKMSSACEAAEVTGSSAFESPCDLIGSCEILLISTPDDEIRSTAECISECLVQKPCGETVFMHMSGALSSDELESLSKKGYATGSLHPLQSFADAADSANALKDTVFTIEGEAAKTEVVSELERLMGNSIYRIGRSQKTMYHIAACMASNYVLALMDFSIEIFKEIGIEEEAALHSICSLARGTLSNIEKMGTSQAITGPISRGDVGTVKRHIESIKASEDRGLLEMYRIAGERTLEIARRLKLGDSQRSSEMGKILTGQKKLEKEIL